MARVAVFEAWFRGSHAAWARSLAGRSRHTVAVRSLPGVHWKWRMQGAPVTFARALPGVITELGGLDAVVATSSVDLSAFAGLGREHLAGIPLVLYLHENQVTFPPAPGEAPDLTYAMATWRSLLTADRVVCNSRHHRDELLGALPAFLAQFPDHRHGELVREVRSRTSVIGVGIEETRFRGDRPDHPVPRILWNHRWEPDKAPGRFVAAMRRLAATGRRFELVVCGSHLPGDVVRRDLGRLVERAVHIGPAPEDDYPALLRSCDLVVSTARHEFYGVAVAEAVAAGVVPVAPNGLAYPELLPQDLHEDLLFDDDAGLDLLLARGIDDAARRRRLSASLRDRASAWSADATIAQVDALLDDVVTAWSTRGTGGGGSG